MFVGNIIVVCIRQMAESRIIYSKFVGNIFVAKVDQKIDPQSGWDTDHPLPMGIHPSYSDASSGKRCSCSNDYGVIQYSAYVSDLKKGGSMKQSPADIGHGDAAAGTNSDAMAPTHPACNALAVHARSLSRIYRVGSVQITGVDGIDLSIPAGRLVVLKGDSGSGKSTLLSLLGGLDRCTAGALSVAGRDLGRCTEAELTDFRRRSVGMIFQSFNLLPTLDVLENVCLPALLTGRAYPAVRRRATELLDWLGLAGRLDHLPRQLSGGEMQRTAIARALINDPALILADEPTGNLDSGNAGKVMALLADLNRTLNRTVIIATHSTLADRYASMLLVLKDGRLAA
jgi:putative ABC transport system ATP-binding protein